MASMHERAVEAQVSHDVRTALTIVLGYSQLLETMLAQRGLTPEAATARRVVVAGGRLRAEIEHLLCEPSRRQPGGPPSPPGPRATRDIQILGGRS